MANFSYKKTETINMKMAGFLDIDKMTINVDEEEKDLKTLLSEFNGACVEINVKIKNETEYAEPTPDQSEDADEQ